MTLLTNFSLISYFSYEISKTKNVQKQEKEKERKKTLFEE